jgi:hypothetical protein
MRRILKFLGWYIGLSTIAALGWLILSFPNYPHSLEGWSWLFLIALPITIIGEFIGEIVSRNPVTQYVENRTSTNSFSLQRIFFHFIVMLLLFGFILGIWFYFGFGK